MPRRRQSSPTKFPRIILSLIVIIIVTSFVWFELASRPINTGSNKKINFTISKGQSLDSIAAGLKETDLIRSIAAFKVQVTISNLATQIQAGDFAIPPNFNLSQVTQALTHGTSDRWLTIPEGWRREQIAQALVDVLAADNPDFAFDADEFISLTKNLEGQLHPNTYSFTRETTAADAVDRLITEFKEVTAELKNNSPLSDYQALILASLIEREAITDAERPVVAGVLLNRYNNDWPLQVDASVQYVKTSRDCQILTCDWWPNNITRDDLQIASAYNTYAQPGLPPAPITNPSLASIKAAYNPKTTNYWFYIHDSQGNIHFSKTIEEHNANIAKYLK